MRAILDLILLILQLYTWVVIATAIMSWLIAFDVVNFRSDFVRAVWNTLNALTEPVLRPIRNVLQNLGGLDIAPVVLLLLLFFLERVIAYYLYPLVIAY